MTDLIFIDTDIFKGYKYDFLNSSFEPLRRLGESGAVKLLLPDVIEREILEDLHEHADEYAKAADEHRSFLRRVSAPNDLDAEHIDKEDYHERLILNFKKLGYAMSVERLECAQFASIVLDSYFTFSPPFHGKTKVKPGGEIPRREEKKERKPEFPDAFAIEAIKERAKRHDGRVFVVSGDGKVRDAYLGHSKICYCAKLADLLSLLNGLSETKLALLTSEINEYLRNMEDEILLVFEELPFEVRGFADEDVVITVSAESLKINSTQIIESKESSLHAVAYVAVAYRCRLEYRNVNYYEDYYAEDMSMEEGVRSSVVEIGVEATRDSPLKAWDYSWHFEIQAVMIRPRTRLPRVS